MQAGRDLWLDEEMQQAALDLHRRVDGRRGPAVHPLHLGQHRQAQGRAAHDGRLPGVRGHHAQAGLRLPPGRHLLLRRRRRLDHRPQLHRLRPARERRHHGDVRVDADSIPTPAATGGWSTTSASTSSTPRRPRCARSRRPATSWVQALQPPVAARARHASASRSTPRSGAGTTTWWATGAARSSTPGGRPRPAAS